MNTTINNLQNIIVILLATCGYSHASHGMLLDQGETTLVWEFVDASITGGRAAVSGPVTKKAEPVVVEFPDFGDEPPVTGIGGLFSVDLSDTAIEILFTQPNGYATATAFNGLHFTFDDLIPPIYSTTINPQTDVPGFTNSDIFLFGGKDLFLQFGGLEILSAGEKIVLDLNVPVVSEASTSVLLLLGLTTLLFTRTKFKRKIRKRSRIDDSDV